ncbi:MAG TPA: XRE family transcriptional regulator [Nocardioidaceae bacterium]|nr:XRE family transcriptional regulator [Nocardioidaceae bacterium]
MAEPGRRGVASIGARIRAERQQRGATVRGLARDIGVSASLISQIENGKSLPSVSTLYAITTALGVPVEELFDPATDGAGESRGSIHAPTGGFADAAGLPAPDRDQPTGPHLCPGGREILALESGVTWERLGQLRGHHVDFLKITYGPGSTSATRGELMQHAGTEYGYLISGELVLTLGAEESRLGPGDSVCFDSTTPHGYRNDGDEPAVGIWFVQEDT